MSNRINQRVFGKWLSILTLIAVCAIWLVPIAWAVIVSLRPPDDPLGAGDVWLSTEGISAESYGKVTELAPFFPQIKDGTITRSYLTNTVVFVLLTLAVQLITVTLGGFAFAHYKFWGRKYFFYFILLQLMIPSAILLVPNFVTITRFSTTDFFIPKALFYKQFSLYDTPWAMAMPYFGSAFGTFLLRQAFLEVPSELVDAGKMDGCRWYQLLWHVYLPPSRPSVVAFALVSVSAHWNELLWPLVITSDKARPLTMGLLRFTQLTDIGSQWSLMMAATMIIIAPLTLMFLVFQRQFIESFLHSGIKS